MDEIISRQAALDALDGVMFPEDPFKTWAKVAIRAVPPAELWHPITSRPMDEEEREYWNEQRGYTLEDDEAVIYSGCPDDGDEVLVCTALGNVYIDTFYSDPDEGCYFEGSGDMDGIVAWMPKPAPYKEERSEE